MTIKQKTIYRMFYKKLHLEKYGMSVYWEGGEESFKAGGFKTSIAAQDDDLELFLLSYGIFNE